MTYKIAMVAQKGGVGKSTLARIIAVEASKRGLNTKIADLNTKQKTCVNWSARRSSNGLRPVIRAEIFEEIETALQDASNFDLYIFDTMGEADSDTLEIARASDLMVIPTSESLDDLEPAVILANNFYKEGVPIAKIRFALCRTNESVVQVEGARDYLSKTPFSVLAGDIPQQTAFKNAMDAGKSVTETSFPTLRRRADAMAQNIIDALDDTAREVA